jgi:vacuolar iron transporter family protein
VWVDTMMREDLGFIESKINPLDNAVNTFVGFNVIGIIPLAPFFFIYALDLNLFTGNTFLYSALATATLFFLIGGISGKVVQKPIIRSGLNTLIIGGIAAIVSYGVGHLLSPILH